MSSDPATEDLVLLVTEVFLLSGRQAVVVGTIESGTLRTGDEVAVMDGERLVLSAVASVGLLCRRPPVLDEVALVLGRVDHDSLRPGQVVRRKPVRAEAGFSTARRRAGDAGPPAT